MRNKSKTNQDISSVIYGLDEQKKWKKYFLSCNLIILFRFLKNLLLKFKQTKQGGSCLLSGRRNSGKTLVLETIIQEEFPSDGEVRVVRIDGLQYKRFAATSKLFEQLRLKDMIETQREMDTEERDESSPKKRGKKEQKTKTTEREMEVRIITRRGGFICTKFAKIWHKRVQKCQNIHKNAIFLFRKCIKLFDEWLYTYFRHLYSNSPKIIKKIVE